MTVAHPFLSGKSIFLNMKESKGTTKKLNCFSFLGTRALEEERACTTMRDEFFYLQVEIFANFIDSIA